ncbi:unnamed protein product, partial [Prorocentrum cordatum]
AHRSPLIDALKAGAGRDRLSTFEACALLVGEAEALGAWGVPEGAGHAAQRCLEPMVAVVRRELEREYGPRAEAEEAEPHGLDDAELERWTSALQEASRQVPPPVGVKRCCICGAALSSPVRMRDHLEGRRHCAAVAERHLGCARAGGAGGSSGSGDGAGGVPAEDAEDAFKRHSYLPMSRCTPEPPDVALSSLCAGARGRSPRHDLLGPGAAGGTVTSAPVQTRAVRVGGLGALPGNEQKHATPSSARVFPLLNPRDPRYGFRLIDFLRRLAERGLVDGRRRRKACVSTFFVAKKNGDIRMVVDARQPNQLPKLPPRTVLASGEALGSINLLAADDASHEHLADFDGCFESLCAGSVDLMDGFYQFADPSWGSSMCFDVEVTADEIGLDSIFDEKLGRRVAVAPDEVIWPCFAALPMGWSWALWICHEVLVDAMDAAGLLGDGWCLDKARAPTLVGRSVVRAPCVDKRNLVSLGATAIDDWLDKLTAELDRRGLRWHELERAQPGLVILGMVLDGREGRLRRTAKRAWRLYLALHHVLRGAPDVLGELATAAGLVFLGEVDLCRAPSDITFATDSSMRGCADCEARLEPREILATTRWRERQRFVASEVEIAPRDELYEGRAAGPSDPSDPLPVATLPRLRRAVARRRRVELEIGAPPEPLAEALLDPSRWTERRRGVWRCPGRIHALEARAAVAPLWRAGGDVAFHGTEVLSLCDNMSSVLAFDKGGATNFELLAQYWRAAAICLGCEIRWRHRHVPGIYNVADHGSRAADLGEL